MERCQFKLLTNSRSFQESSVMTIFFRKILIHVDITITFYEQFTSLKYLLNGS